MTPTAKEIYDKHVGKYHRQLSPANYQNVLAFALEIAKLSWEASHEHWSKKLAEDLGLGASARVSQQRTIS